MDSKETYIKSAFEKIIPLFRERGLPIDEIDEMIQIKYADIPPKWAGYCQSWISGYYPQEKHEILINNTVDNGFDAIAVLIHEVCHAIQFHLYGDEVRPHGKEFEAIAEAVGLTGKMTNTYPNKKLEIKIKAWEKEIDVYPHEPSFAEMIEKWILILINYFGSLYLLAMIVQYNTP
jgi:hypothetical protein